MLLLLAILLSAAVLGIQWQPLNIALIVPNDLHMSAYIANGLKLVIHQYRWLIQIRKDSATSSLTANVYRLRCMSMEFGKQMNATSIIFWPIYRQRPFRLTSNIQLYTANFVLFLQDHCKNGASVLASAAPCGVIGDQRPVAGKLYICQRQNRLLQFPAIIDLFRHEILHALGFGTIIPKKNLLQSRFFFWNLSESKQMIGTPYMEFQKGATEFARKHFNCNSLPGIEAEDFRRMHLDEYIYGDELMTPKLSPYKNYFTYITAKILEETTRNDQPWYRTNRKMVARESSNYWYGRQWGCVFAMSSCYDYIRRKRNVNTFPFCNSKDYTQILFTNDNSKQICLGNKTHVIKLLVHCPLHPMQSLYEQHPSGLQSRPLAEHFSILRGTPLANFYAGLSTYRFCPFIQEVAFGLINGIPKHGHPVKCNSTKIPLLLN